MNYFDLVRFFTSQVCLRCWIWTCWPGLL